MYKITCLYTLTPCLDVVYGSPVCAYVQGLTHHVIHMHAHTHEFVATGHVYTYMYNVRIYCTPSKKKTSRTCCQTRASQMCLWLLVGVRALECIY